MVTPNDLIQFDGPDTAWKITLDTPLGGDHDADEESAAKLAGGFTEPPGFTVADNGSVVSFRARVNGARTEGTEYPRTELREMQAAHPDQRASWKTNDSTSHSMQYDVAVIAAPKKKPQVVCGQIHNGGEDILEIMYDGKKKAIVYRWFGESQDDKLITGYELGTFFTLRIDVADGKVNISINGDLKATKSVSKSGCYFKAGCYTQSNMEKEGGDASQFGEVWIKNLRVTGGGV
ncbi:polysaccharide lyase family 7 protein [Actinomycetes bacterium KLBMP 9797]